MTQLLLLSGNSKEMSAENGVRLIGWGILLGAVGLFFATRLVETMLYKISAFDPLTLAAVAGALMIVTILAALVPALRAARLDPIETLRAE